MGLFGFKTKDSQPASGSDQVGPYRLQELINSGGLADIWLATNPEGKPFALKRLHHDLRFDSAAKKRFVRGCEILAKIHNHEYVIGYVEHGKTDGDMYLIMEYVEASNLKQLIARTDPILAEFVGNIIIDMAHALEHVHASGFIHLDFKPENVLVTRNGSVRLVDFDLTLPMTDEPFTLAKTAGTPAYMAPEQLLKHPMDHRVDIFAYGVSAYEVLTSQHPFPGDNADEVLRRQTDRSQPVVPPRELNPDIPFALEKTLLKCLERDPEKRYPFMSVLVRDLEAALYV